MDGFVYAWVNQKYVKKFDRFMKSGLAKFQDQTVGVIHLPNSTSLFFY